MHYVATSPSVCQAHKWHNKNIVEKWVALQWCRLQWIGSGVSCKVTSPSVRRVPGQRQHNENMLECVAREEGEGTCAHVMS